MNNEQTKAFLTLLSAYARDKKRKKLKSIRNKRYYQKHKDELKRKNQIKNQLYQNYKQKYNF